MVSNAIPGKTHRKHLAEGWELRSHISRTLQNNETVLRLGTGPDHANFGVKFHKFQPVLQNLGQIYGESNPSPLWVFSKLVTESVNSRSWKQVRIPPFSEICDFSMLDWHIEVGGLAYFRHATNRVLESKC